MGNQGRPSFDLNESPGEEDEDYNILCSSPQKKLPIDTTIPIISQQPEGSQSIVNSHKFTHASVGSAFQPFNRTKDGQNSKEFDTEKTDVTTCSNRTASPIGTNGESGMDASILVPVVSNAQGVEREEGEWSEVESDDVPADSSCNKYKDISTDESVKGGTSDRDTRRHFKGPDLHKKFVNRDSFKNGNSQGTIGLDRSRNLKHNSKEDIHADRLDIPSPVAKQNVRGIEAAHALRFANNPTKKPKLDYHKEAMLGKKRNRQTVFLNTNEVIQAGPMKSVTPKRQSFLSHLSTQAVKDTSCVNPPNSNKDRLQTKASHTENSHITDVYIHKTELNGENYSGSQDHSKKSKFSNDHSTEVCSSPVHRQSWKQSVDPRHGMIQQNPSKKSFAMNQNISDKILGNKKQTLARKPNGNNTMYQDTSVERLLREVTNENFWCHPEEKDLECVPGQFESVEDYTRVFEPLLLEECRAQLYSTWEESTEHIMVRVKHVERRERGWYDVIVLPQYDVKWPFKEGDAAVLSLLKPGAVKMKRSINASIDKEDLEVDLDGRCAGTVRRHTPTDTRDQPGAIVHFYVGDSYDSNSKVNDNNFLRRLQPNSIWYLTVLGSLATTQREYVALHAFHHLNLQMQTAILKPSPEQFPKYEENPPAMPECFTQSFVDHLHRAFNGPQLSAIQWAAMHTAAGTSGVAKKRTPWPFTLVQGPPGTGKTHTVWGMLNVIHLVQYQHYYAAFLKKLAPESYRPLNENNYESTGTGSIDKMLQTMDQSIYRTLPKLCPKPRMLVCAPSNAATDELLARVLNRGFIDGEMKVYRPDVARVGVDSQTCAAQAVSVEQRANALLEKGREEVIGWMQNLKIHETQCAQRIVHLQRELNAEAVSGRSQNLGVDPEILVARDRNRDNLLQNLAQIVEQRDKILVEMSRLLILEDKFRSGNNFNIEDAKAKLEASFANEAEIVFTTVSSSGRKLFSRLTHGFDMIVIDEAAQASEVGVLPPLTLGAARCVLVGDPQQLPATVISKAAGSLLYSRSLFERFQQAGCPTILLSVQYRMHPQIRDFPSRYFYQGRLTDSDSVSNMADEIYYKDPLMQPFVFFDILHGRESHKNGSVSYQNSHEAQFCLRIYEHLQNAIKSAGSKKVSVGIITPYKLQQRCIEQEFDQVLKSEEGKDLYINTVDAFQGQERDVIIMSCVRASRHGVGFVSDIRRMNVALTRARRALWIVGNANALVQSEDWGSLISDAKSRKCFMDHSSIPKEFLVMKVASLIPGRGGPRTGFPRLRNADSLPESEDNTSIPPRNNSHRNLRLQNNKSMDETHTSEKSRDFWQHGTAKRHTSFGNTRRNM